MKKIVFLVWLLTITPFMMAQQIDSVSTRGVGSQASQPKVMVVPYAKEGQDIRELIESNPMMSLSLSKVKEAFSQRGFPTRDFVTMLKAVKTNEVISEAVSAQSDVLKSIVRNSKVDISVSVTAEVNKFEGGLSEVMILLAANETATGASLANASYGSDEFATTDSVKLADRALDKISDNFFYQLQSSFADMVENGRELKVLIELGPNCEIDAYTPIGTEGDDFETALHSWMGNNSYKGTYDIVSSDKYIEISMRVPVYDPVSGNPFSIGKMRAKIQRYLHTLVQPLGHGVRTVRNAGQVINFIIE